MSEPSDRVPSAAEQRDNSQKIKKGVLVDPLMIEKKISELTELDLLNNPVSEAVGFIRTMIERVRTADPTEADRLEYRLQNKILDYQNNRTRAAA